MFEQIFEELAKQIMRLFLIIVCVTVVLSVGVTLLVVRSYTPTKESLEREQVIETLSPEQRKVLNL